MPTFKLTKEIHKLKSRIQCATNINRNKATTTHYACYFTLLRTYSMGKRTPRNTV